MADERIERLVARADITDLLTRYAIGIDDQDWDAFADLWTDDASFEVDAEGGFFGKEAVLEFLEHCLPAGYVGKHFLSQPLVELADDLRTATVRTDVVWFTQDFATTIIGRYNDEVVRGDDGRWRIRRRWETTVPYRDEPTPMSDAAKAMSDATMRQEPGAASGSSG
jgi:uncharacterized protein (TIGR02246 family)